jgi:hypothetical protein
MAALRRPLDSTRLTTRLALATAICVAGLVLWPDANASIAVSPMRIEVGPAPGGQAEVFELTVANTCHETPREVALSIQNFWIGEDGRLQVDDEVDPAIITRYGGAGYVSTDVESISLGVREERRVPFSVRLPSTATGVYGALITADGGIAAPSLQLGAPFDLRVRFQVSVFVLITAHSVYAGAARAPSTPVRRELAVTEVYTDLPYSGDGKSMARVHAHIANTGSSHVSGRITATIVAVAGGRVLEQLVMEGGTRLLLPGSRRRFYGDIRSSLSPDLYRVTVQVAPADGAPPATGSGQLQLMAEVPGAPPEAPRFRVLSLDRAEVLMTANARRADRQDVEVRNHLREPVRVEVASPAGANAWLTASPQRFTLPALGSRSVRVRAASDSGIQPGKHAHEIVLTPQPRGSDAPLAQEAIRLRVVVISPRTDD